VLGALGRERGVEKPGCRRLVDGVEETAARARTTGGAPQGRRERGYVDEPTIGAQSLAGQRQMGSAKRTDMVNDRAIVTFACLPTLVDKHMQYA